MPALGAALSDPDPKVRLAVTEALGQIEAETVKPYLIAAMKDANPEVRRAAAEELGNRD